MISVGKIKRKKVGVLVRVALTWWLSKCLKARKRGEKTFWGVSVAAEGDDHTDDEERELSGEPVLLAEEEAENQPARPRPKLTSPMALQKAERQKKQRADNAQAAAAVAARNQKERADEAELKEKERRDSAAAARAASDTARETARREAHEAATFAATAAAGREADRTADLACRMAEVDGVRQTIDLEEGRRAMNDNDW